MASDSIPEAAIEAAAEALFVRSLDFSDNGSFRKDARTALEAAAPHMLAAALEEAADAWGEAASWSDGRPSAELVQRWLRSRANSYRPTP